MSYWDKKVIRDQLDKKLASLKKFSSSEVPSQGWIKTIREALGLSADQLGKKVGIDQSRISRLETAEKDGSLKLSSLQKIARGLNMQFVYGFVPIDKSTLEQLVTQQARQLALKRLKRLNDTMLLEQQGLSDKDQKKALQDMIQKILVEQPKELWD